MVEALLSEPMVIAVPELLHVYADALHVQIEKCTHLIGQGLLPEPMVIAIPELLHVYADTFHVQ